MLSQFKISDTMQLNFDNSRLHVLVGQNGCGKSLVLQRIANELEFSPSNSPSYHALDSIALADTVQKIPWNSIKPVIQLNGNNLPLVLDHFREYTRNYLECNNLTYIQKNLSRIIPSVQGVQIIQFNRCNRDYVEIKLNTNTCKDIRAFNASKRTMLVLGMLAILLNPYQPKLVLLDNVEKELHPKAQRKLIAVFKEIIQADLDSELQLILSTHSPYVIDELALSQVHVLSNTRSGEIHCKRLDEHPDAEWAKQTLTTGEFWDSVGEDWVTEF